MPSPPTHIHLYCRYDIYDITGPPYLWYNITIDILEFGGVEEGMKSGQTVLNVEWDPVATVVISPEAMLRRSEDGRVGEHAWFVDVR